MRAILPALLLFAVATGCTSQPPAPEDPVLAELTARARAVCDARPNQVALCIPFAGCEGDSGPAWVGRATAQEGGGVHAGSTTGVRCDGRWTARDFRSRGTADTACSDGTSGRIAFTYTRPSEGEATGQVSLAAGQSFTVRSGRDIARQFSGPDRAAERAAERACFARAFAREGRNG